jgi:glycosyltransferase involved in cell wall biosynthesis
MASSTQRKRVKSVSKGRMVQISAVVCTLNRAAYLAKAVQSLVNQTYPKHHYEIIVVDNGSTDNTRDVVEQFSQSATIRYIYEPIKGLSQARNTGWQAASGKYVAYIDDDAIACPHWLEKMMEAFDTVKPAPASVGGKAVPLWESERPAWLEDRMLGAYAIVDWGDRARFLKPSSPEHHVGCNVAFTRQVLQECGGFNVNLGRKGKNLLSNDEHLIRKYMDCHGLGIYYDPEILVDHLVPKERLTRRFMLRRHFWQGISDVVEWYEESSSPPGRLWSLISGLEGLAWVVLYFIGFLLWSFLRRPVAVARDLLKIETTRNYFFRSLYHPSSSLGQSRGYLQIGMGRLIEGTRKAAALEQGAGNSSHPPPKNWNRMAWWSYPYVMLKRNLFGIGGIFLLVIVGLYVSGALVESLRWYLVGTASALLLLCGGLLALSYVRSSLKRMYASLDEMKKALSALKATLVELRKEMKTIERELSVTKDDVFIIGYDILKEQNKLAEKVSQLETKAGNSRRVKRPPKDSTK